MKKYPSRISIFLVILTLGVPVAVSIYGVMTNQDWHGFIVLAIIMLFCLYMLTTTCYHITDDKQLVIKTFFLTSGTLDLTKIKSVEKSRTVLSAPACSLKRIRLTFTNGDEAVISPRYQDDFLQEIKKINPTVEIDPRLLTQN